MRKSALLCGLLLLVLCRLGFPQPCGDASGLIQVAPPSLNFGDVSVGSSKTLSFTIMNVEPGFDMNVLSLNSQNSIFQIVGAPNVPFCIGGGQAVTIEVEFAPKAPGVVVSKIRIDSTGGLAFVGTAANATGGGGGGGANIEVSPGSLNFGKVQVGQTASESFSIINQGSSEVSIDKINSSNKAFAAASPSFPRTIQSGGSLEVTATFTPSKSGSFEATLSVVSGGSTAAGVDVRGEGSAGNPNINLNPSQLDFGSTDIGTFVVKSLNISNTGNAPLQVSFPPDPFVIITPPGPVSIAPGKSAPFNVKLIADSLGQINRNINVLSNDPDTPKAPLNLRASGVQGPFGFVNRTARSRIAPNPNATSALQFVDFDLDGKTDLYLTGHDGNLMCKNNGGAQFSNSTNTNKLGNNGNDSRGVTWGDVDNDGDLDVFIANFNAPSVIMKNNNNVFTSPGGSAPTPGLFSADATTKSTGGIFVDFNNDKLLDVFVVKNGESNQLFKNLGSFRFADIASSARVAFKGPGRSAVAADFNGDGFMDLYVVNFKRPNKLYINNKNETFKDTTAPAGVGFSGASVQAAAVDFDADGDIDIFVVNQEGPSVLYRNQGNLKFQNVAGAAGLTLPKKGSSATWSDFDRDGDLDVVIVQSPGENMLFSNNGNGKFTRVTNVDLSNSDDPSAVVNGDSDNDGDTDVAIGDEDSGANSGDSIYQNTGGGGNNFLVLTLQGTRSNATAIGAKVIVRFGALVQAQIVSGGDGKNQSSLPLEFGLGSVTSAQVIIAWPSGIIQTLDNVSANQKLKIVEPAN